LGDGRRKEISSVEGLEQFAPPETLSHFLGSVQKPRGGGICRHLRGLARLFVWKSRNQGVRARPSEPGLLMANCTAALARTGSHGGGKDVLKAKGLGALPKGFGASSLRRKAAFRAQKRAFDRFAAVGRPAAISWEVLPPLFARRVQLEGACVFEGPAAQRPGAGRFADAPSSKAFFPISALYASRWGGRRGEAPTNRGIRLFGPPANSCLAEPMAIRPIARGFWFGKRFLGRQLGEK